jgi:2'-5' RNA ligase superfamily
MLAIESALVVLVPEAEVIVKSFRDKYDPSAANGCPAHVGVLYPFKHPDEITKTDYDNLSRCVALFKPFRFSLAVTRRFPGVLYFAPEPDEQFRRLTFAIWDCYPETPPYGGRYPDVVPHLTVANQLADDQLDGITAELKEASEGKLPIAAVASEIALLDTRSGYWQVRAMLKLGGSLRPA